MRFWILTALIGLLLWPALGLAQSDKVRFGREVEQAEQLAKQGRIDDALAAYDTALKSARRIFGNNHVYCASLLKSQGDLTRRAGRYERAEPYLLEGLQICNAIGDRELGFEMQASLASSYVERGKYEEALEMTLKVLAASESLYGKSASQSSKIQANLGGVLRSLGRDQEAERAFLKAIAIQERMPAEEQSLASSLMNIANVYVDRGDFLKAESTMQRALALAERAYGKSTAEAAYVRNNIGVLYQNIGLWAKAEEMHRGVLKTLEATLGPEHVQLASSYNNLAIVLDRQKKFAEAEPRYRRSLEIRKSKLEKGHPTMLISLQALGTFLAAQNRFEEAEPLLVECLDLRREKLGPQHPEVAHSLSSLAFLRYRQGRFDEALKFHQQELAVNASVLPPAHPRTGGTYAGIGATEVAAQHWEEAAKAFGESRIIARRYVDSVLPGLSEPEQLAFLKETDEPQFHKAIGLAIDSPEGAIVDATAEWVVNGKAVSQQALAQRALLMRDAVDQTVAALANNVRDLRKRLAAALHAGGDSQAKQRSEIADLTRKEAESSRQLAAKTGRAASASEWVGLATLRERIPADAAVIELVRFDRFNHLQESPLPDAAHYGAWIIPSKGDAAVQFVDLGLANSIDDAVRAARKSLQDSVTRLKEAGEADAEAALKPVLAKLSEKILQPVVSKLGDVKRLYLSPDSQLWIVPWSALPLADGSYAVEKLDIRYLVSSRDLVHGEIKVGDGRAVMMADPNYDLDPAGIKAAVVKLLGKPQSQAAAFANPSGMSKLGIAPRLPGTRLEAQAIEPKVKEITGSDPQLWIDEFALEQAFKGMRQPRLLVVCTHGFFQEKNDASQPAASSSPLGAALFVNPLVRCGLLLAGCNKPDRSTSDSEDGILTGIEIVETDLRGTELVVLSACETGLGEIQNGEGVSGLRQAFQLAGARSVISTLWQIPDIQSARLMREFFTRLAQSGDKASALREAQLATIESRRDRYGAAHPFFWAAFTLTGE